MKRQGAGGRLPRTLPFAMRRRTTSAMPAARPFALTDVSTFFPWWVTASKRPRACRFGFRAGTMTRGPQRCQPGARVGLKQNFYREGAELHMQIIVRDNNVDQALRALKKKLQREGVYREMKLRRHYEKPSEKRAREKAAAVRRARKLDRKRAERDSQR